LIDLARGKRAGDALRGVVAQGVVDHPDTDTLGQSNHSPERLEHLIGESVRQYDARKPPFLQPARAIRNHAASGARKVPDLISLKISSRPYRPNAAN